MIKSILVLGGGSAGLLTAITLKGRLPTVNVIVLRSKDIGVIGVGEGTTVSVTSHLHGYLGIHPGSFLRETQAIFKLGIRFLWGERPYFDFPFARGLDVRLNSLPKPVGFYAADDMSDFSLPSALLARNRVFARDAKGLPVVEPWFAYHIENETFVGWLDGFAKKLGVHITEGTVGDVRRDAYIIQTLLLEDGREFAADLFIDSSGFRSKLIGATLGEKYIDYSSSLWCERAVVGGWDRGPEEPIQPYTIAETMNAGWSWRIDHERRINRGYVFCPAFISDEEAEKEFRIRNPKVGATRLIRFRSGRHERAWVGNVVAIGNAFGFVEPLEATNLAVICQAAQHLGEFLNDGDCVVRESQRSAFNTLQARTFDAIRWFLSIHYKFNGRLHTPFWRECREKVNIAGAADIVEYYQENGPSGLFRHSLLDSSNPFGVEGYLAMLVGQKVPYRRTYNPTQAEQNAWERFRATMRQSADAACSVEETLKHLRSSNWQWKRSTFLSQVPSTMPAPSA
jgi:tryptophan halogenase